MKRSLFTISHILFIISLPLLFISLSLTVAFNCQPLYSYGFDKYGVEETTGLERSELDLASRELISYFNSGEELIDIVVTKNGEPFELFNEREVLHLKDVKDLVKLNYTVLLFTGLYILGFSAVFLTRRTHEWQNLLKNAIYGSMLTILIIGVLGLTALVDFNWLFLQFHLISFANDLWLLNPATDYLIMMFPQGFWFDATFLCAIMAISLAVITWGIACAVVRKAKKVK